MALFPDATFSVFLPPTGVIPGTRAEGHIRLDVPSDIPRADHIHMFFRTRCVAGYGSGKHRSVHTRDVFVSPLEVRLDRNHPLKAGSYTYPFAIDLPPWLPPSYFGNDCSIQHVIEARLDVDWAVDPKATVTPVVAMSPVEIVAAPLMTRSPQGFHEKLVVEVTLDRRAVPAGEMLTGQVALRNGHDARFDAITVAIASMATISMARGDRRRGTGSTVRIPADALRGGQSVPFAIPCDPRLMPPSFRNGFIDHDVYLIVEADIPWASDPSFELPIQLLPQGSRVHADMNAQVSVGAERLFRLAGSMAAATGFAPGRLPTLVEGNVGPVRVAISDSLREGMLGVDLSFEFPDLGLGTNFRPLGMLEGFRQSPLLPPALNSQYFLRAEPPRPVAPEALTALYGAILSGFAGGTDVRLNDHHLGVRQPLANDGGEAMTQLAQWTRARADLIAQAISRLPFAPDRAAAAPAWQATAAEQNAFLVPHLPSLVGIAMSSRIVGGEQRSLGIELRGANDGTVTAHLDLRGALLPRSAWGDIEKGTDVEGLRAVRSVFARIDVHSADKVTLEGAAFPSDPRALLSTIEVFFWWLLETRGERRADAPYR